jgi:hypothetical protein
MASTTTTEPRRAALAALAAFGPVDRDAARKLLRMWVHADEPTDADVAAVLEHFPSAPGRADR